MCVCVQDYTPTRPRGSHLFFCEVKQKENQLRREAIDDIKRELMRIARDAQRLAESKQARQLPNIAAT